MKDELITFSTAKLAKEKGFRELCKYGYGKKGELRWFDEDANFNFYKGTYVQLSAPTQSLLQRWLRDEKNISVEVKLNFNINYFNWAVYQIKPQNVICCQKVVGLYTYEEALENGLQEALKLI
tara:strand:- start:6352 stop:6720 length:369 start_codon:yes stop_codon:yes gene_type:complete